MFEQFIPEAIGFGAGYLSGVALDQLSVRRASADVKPLVAAWSIETPESQKLTASKRERLAHVLGRVSPAAALSLGLTVAFGTAAFVPLESTVVKPATIELVVDHSGATEISFGNQGPVLPEINQVATAFTSSNRINSNAFVASFGSVTEKNVSAVDSLSASGNAPLDTALSNALDQTAIIKSGNKSESAAVVVITNGNSVGSVQSVVEQSNQQGKTPVYVVNVEGSKVTSAQNISSFEQIAKRTDGKYWSANSANISAVTSDVEQTLTPEHKHNNADPYQDMFILAALIGGVLTVKTYRNRRHGLLQRNIEGK